MSHYKVVSDLVLKYNLTRIAELGVYKGSLTKSVLNNCPNIREYYAIDQWKVVVGPENGKFALKTQDDWDAIYMKACKHIPFYSALKIIRLPAVKAASLFPVKYYAGFFDLVYIDTSHFYEPTLAEIKAWLPLVRKGGLMGGHDYAAVRPEHQGVRKAVDEVFGKENIQEGDDMVWYTEVK